MEKKKDRHKHPMLVLRLPPIYKKLLGDAAGQGRRSMTEEAKIAFEKHFETLGLWPPPPASRRHPPKSGE
jgi:hypothetical protein